MSAYRSSPFYEHYADDLQMLLSQRHEYMYDLNMKLLSFCLEALHWKKRISETTAFSEGTPPEVLDLRAVITDQDSFLQRGLYRPVPYYQVFGTGFGENLSLIDLLFCKGPQASEILGVSRDNRLNK